MCVMHPANLLRIPTPTHGGHGPLFFSPFWGVTLCVEVGISSVLGCASFQGVVSLRV
jgi:hypothetical protein